MAKINLSLAPILFWAFSSSVFCQDSIERFDPFETTHTFEDYGAVVGSLQWPGFVMAFVMDIALLGPRLVGEVLECISEAKERKRVTVDDEIKQKLVSALNERVNHVSESITEKKLSEQQYLALLLASSAWLEHQTPDGELVSIGSNCELNQKVLEDHPQKENLKFALQYVATASKLLKEVTYKDESEFLNTVLGELVTNRHSSITAALFAAGQKLKQALQAMEEQN